MIKAILVSMMFVCGIANAQETKKERPPVDWQPVIGVNVEGGKFYIDMKSVTTTRLSGNRKFNSADLMISYDKPTIAMSANDAVLIRSKVHSMVIDCESGLAAPVMDLYFKEPMPTRESKPLAGERYPANPHFTMFQVDKRSLLYNLLCPIYI